MLVMNLKFQLTKNTMDIIKCPKCHEDVEINIERSITDDGEIFECPHCGFQFLYI